MLPRRLRGGGPDPIKPPDSTDHPLIKPPDGFRAVPGRKQCIAGPAPWPWSCVGLRPREHELVETEEVVLDREDLHGGEAGLRGVGPHGVRAEDGAGGG